MPAKTWPIRYNELKMVSFVAVILLYWHVNEKCHQLKALLLYRLVSGNERGPNDKRILNHMPNAFTSRCVRCESDEFVFV